MLAIALVHSSLVLFRGKRKLVTGISGIDSVEDFGI